MTYETFKFIIAHKKRFLYDRATGTGSDNTTDPGAANVNPNAYLAPIIGKTSITSILIIIFVVLGIVYFSKNLLKWQTQ